MYLMYVYKSIYERHFYIKYIIYLQDNKMEGFKKTLIAQSNVRFMSVGGLLVGHSYPITKMFNQDTQYGRTAKCTLDDGVGGIIEVFLPRSIIISEEEEELYNMGGNQTLSLVFNRRRGRSFNINFK